MTSKKSKSGIITAVIISVVATALLVGGIFYFWGKTQIDSFNQTNQTLQSQNKELTDAKNELIRQYGPSNVIDEEIGLKANDYLIVNKVMTEILPRVCLDKQKKSLDLDNPVCLLKDIENKGGDATDVLKGYLNSL